MTDAIWRGDADAVRELVLRDPRLLHEAARGLADSNWGPPMWYAANLGQDRIIQMLREMGATDVQHAFDRACLQGQIETARRLHAMGARPTPGCVMGPCETLNDGGLAFLLELGAELADEGRRPPRAGRFAAPNLQPLSRGQAPLPRPGGRARPRTARHAGNGDPSRPHQPPRKAPEPRSADAWPDFFARGDLSAAVGLQRRPFLRAAWNAHGRHDPTAHLRRFR